MLGLGQRVMGQSTRADSSLLVAAKRSLNHHYTSTLGDESRLYNGPEYISYVRHNTQGHRFFGPDTAQAAAITYGGHTYANVPLRYDLVRGQLVVTAPGGALTLLLVNEQVTRFAMGGHSFVRLVADSSGSSPVRTGYYDLLVDGPVQLLAARHKTYLNRPRAEGVESTITASNNYFLCKEHRYYPVNKAGELLRLFPEKRVALRQYIKSNGLKFNLDKREQALVALVRYQATLAGPGH